MSGGNSFEDEALILRVKKWETADKYVVAYTKAHGKQRFIAYGALYPRNVNGRLLQPFACVNVTLQKGQRVDRLQSCELVELPQSLDMLQMAYAAVAAELTALFTEDGQVQEELYELLQQTLKLLKVRHPRIIVLAFALKLLALTGILPELETCTHCGQVLEENDEGWFSASESGLLCHDCRTLATGTVLDHCGAGARDLWRSLLLLNMENPEHFTVKGEALMELEKLLFRYIYYQTDKELKSLQFLHEVQGMQ